ncbi:energy-coupling factor transporter ATPase [Anoxynatronum buryatiense]|uniref:ABC transporter ATP-binding protein n=1 Tax=Anoxynatronum buryatiense TaxID=489973 RepID=A0AA45WWG6_9CLOT|nr:energy-coupling factor transport system ATP-binding protein [Anoxynatronum buryatiense]
MDKLIEVKDLTFVYGRGTKQPVKALKNVNLDIMRGEFLTILGHNGSGKSTLARHFNGLLTPSKGEVLVDGISVKDRSKLWEIRKRVGMVFQNPDNQIVSTVVEEDVAFGPENLGIPADEIRQRVDWALETLNMTEYRREEPHQLSGGQKQRVAIAGVLATRPECIVLDEPTALLDPIGRNEVIEAAKKLNRDEGITVVLITHFMNEAIESDRIVVMDRGEITLSGTPRDIFDQVELIRELGLDIPMATQIALGLRQRGIQVADHILAAEELVNSLCPSS